MFGESALQWDRYMFICIMLIIYNFKLYKT